MSEQEKRFDLPNGGTLTLRPVTPDDDAFLLALYESTRDKELSQVEWPPGQRETFVRWQFDLQRKEYSSRFPDARYYVLVIDGEQAGRIWIGENDEQLRLLDIGILPDYQNRGAGTLLVRWLIEEANLRQKPLRHMVFVLNNDADRFYERLGFTMIDDLGGYKHMEYRAN